MELYKGYVLTNGKGAKEDFAKEKKPKLKTYDQVKDEHEFGGVLAEETILVDIDTEEQSDLMMDIVEALQLNCKVIQTARGRHFLFRNTNIKKCGTGVPLACGLTADIKVGLANTYEVLKLDGVERFVEWDAEIEGEYDDLPKFMTPIKGLNIDFLDLEEGEGRNSTLFSYILTLNRYGFSKDEARETIRIINQFILKEPLSEDEIELILRDEAFPEDVFFKGRTFLHHNFAEFIKNNESVKKINGYLHVYRDGAYVSGYRYLEGAMVKHIPILKASQRQEVLKYIEIITDDEKNVAPSEYIAFNNGIYDITTGKLIDYDPDLIITNKIPWNYDPTAYSEIADKTLNKIACQDKEIRSLLEECIGYTFYRRNEMSKAFILTGKGANGKSTFLDMVKNLLGLDNYSGLDLEELDERFSVATMAGKLANIGDDISDEFLHGRSISTFKKIVSGNQVKAEMKGQDPFFFNPTVKLLFSANDIPRMKDKTGAVLRRLVIVPFNGTFSKGDPDYDPYIITKLRTEEVMKYLIQLGLEGLKRVIENNGFTESAKVKKEIDDFEKINNPILQFIDDQDQSDIINQPTKDVHRAYRVFCAENGYNEMTLANFTKDIGRYLNLTVQRRRIGGKLIGLYVKG